jgi:hypothetical protein
MYTWLHYWSSYLLERGYKQLNYNSFLVGFPGLYKPEETVWFLKGSFVIAPRPHDLIYFLYGPIIYDKFSAQMTKKAMVSLSLSWGWLDTIGECRRFIEAIPDDLVLCLDIKWAKSLIEAYFKDS